MTRAFKTLFVWLLIAALPLQGMAAVVKASCGASHHHSTGMVGAATGNVDADAGHSVHRGHGAPTGHASHGNHDNHTDHTDHGGHAPAATADSSASPDSHQNASCSACAACCAGAAVPASASILTPAYHSSEAVSVSPKPLVAGFIPSGLERPPRPFPA